MHEFLSANRQNLIDRCRTKVAQRNAPAATKYELEHGIAHFLDQLIETLQAEETAEETADLRRSDEDRRVSTMSEMATKHGKELSQHGFTVDQVVHDYGDLCQAVTDLAFEVGKLFKTGEFRTLNRCLDDAIAAAVVEFNHQRDFVLAEAHADALNERLGSFAHEMRNQLNIASLSLDAIKQGNVGLSGATGALLDRSFVGMRSLINRSLSDVRLTAGMPPLTRLFSLSDFINEVKVFAGLEANMQGCVLTVHPVDSKLAVNADRDLLSAAVGNLLQNAFKFTRHHTEVTLFAHSAKDRVLIHVQDNCGGIPGDPEKLFLPFTQTNEDKTGVGLGLLVSRRSVEANGGTLSVHNMPGLGCVFTIDLPGHTMPEAFSVVTGSAAS